MAKATKKLIAVFVITLTAATVGYIGVSEIGSEEPRRGECKDCD